MDHLLSRIRAIAPDVPVVQTVFRSEPLASVNGSSVYMASTSEDSGSAESVADLQRRYGCRVVGHTPHLSHRRALADDLRQGLPGCDVLLTELKAASVDMAVEMALARKKHVVFLHNRPEVVGGDRQRFSQVVGTIWQTAQRHSEGS